MSRAARGLATICLLALAGAAAPAAARWRPPQRLTWYWQLQGPVINSRQVQAYDIDGFDNPRAEVSRLHRLGRHVVCYIDAGTWESWRPDAGRFPASALGQGNGWAGERWLDIRQPAVRGPIDTRLRRQCAGKGFDAVELDNIDAFANRSGFGITYRDQLRFNRWLARRAHRAGLAVFQKNDPAQVRQLEPYFDGALLESCVVYAECSSYQPYFSSGKPVLDAEYRQAPSRFCAGLTRLGIMGAGYDLALDGRVWRPCW